MTLALSAAKAFVLGEVEQLERVAGDLSNGMWRAETSTGTYAIKALDAARYRESELCRAIAFERIATRLGVSAPRLVRSAHGSYVQRAEHECVRFFTRVHHWISGPATPLSQPASRAAGAVLARLHRMGTPQPDERARRTLDTRDVAAGLERLGFDAAARPTLEQAFQAWQEPDDDIAQRVMCHQDFKPENAILQDSRLFVLDWDQAKPANPRREFATACLRWSDIRDATVDESLLVAFVEGYAREHGPVDHVSEQDFGGWIGDLLSWFLLNLREATSAGGAGTGLAAIDNLTTTLAGIRGALVARQGWTRLVNSALARRLL